jgi:hypothetical protein
MLHTPLQFILLLFQVSRTAPTTLIFGTLDISLLSTQENGEVSVEHGSAEEVVRDFRNI